MRNIPPTGVRMPPELKDRLDAAKKKNGRSLNSEIVTRLEQSFEGGRDLSAIPSGDLLHEVIQRYAGQVQISIDGTAAADLVKAAADLAKPKR